MVRAGHKDIGEIDVNCNWEIEEYNFIREYITYIQ